MGKKITYVRRKRDRECFNGEETEKIIFQENCPCTEMDFECDADYKRTDSGQCEPMKEIIIAPPEECEDYYTISKGYRRIPGNTCEGGGEYDPIKLSCPGQWGIFTFKTFLVVLILGAAYYVITESEWIVGVVDWINDKWSSFRGESDGKGYSKDLNRGPESVGDSDDDEKIISNNRDDQQQKSSQRKRRGDDLESISSTKNESSNENLIDINKYADSDDENASSKLNP